MDFQIWNLLLDLHGQDFPKDKLAVKVMFLNENPQNLLNAEAARFYARAKTMLVGTPYEEILFPKELTDEEIETRKRMDYILENWGPKESAWIERVANEWYEKSFED